MKRKTLVDEYMNEIIDYGGLYWTRADVIRDMQRMGHPQSAIDRWFQGYEMAMEIRARRLRTESAISGEVQCPETVRE